MPSRKTQLFFLNNCSIPGDSGNLRPVLSFNVILPFSKYSTYILYRPTPLFFGCPKISTPQNTYSPPGLLVLRPVPAAAFEPAVLLSPFLPVLQRTAAASVVDKLVPLAPAASHILTTKQQTLVSY